MQLRNSDIGKWFWFESLVPVPRAKWIARLAEIRDNDQGHFIFKESYCIDGTPSVNNENVFGDLAFAHFLEDCRGLATAEQIHSCLESYAKRHGYICGAKYKSIDSEYNFSITSDLLKYDFKRDCLYSDDGDELYIDGVWATLENREVTKQVFQEHIQDRIDLEKKRQEFSEQKEYCKDEPLKAMQRTEFPRISCGCRGECRKRKTMTKEKDYHTINGHPVHISVLIDSYLKLMEIKKIAK